MSSPITVTIARRAATERAQEMVAWMQAGIRLASDFPGFLGAGWVRPTADSDEWHLLYRFDGAATLHDWDSSQQRAWWLGAGAPFVEETRVERRTGIEGWFDEPTSRDVQDLRPPPSAPPRWKQGVVIWLAFFPLSLLLGLLLTATGVHFDIVQRSLITTIVATPIMTYALLPWMTKRFEWWLKP
jgi:uncharacterized protein